MILIISPAKKLDFDTPPNTNIHSQASFLSDTQELLSSLSQESPESLGKLMNISENLSQLNYERYQSFQFPFTPKNAKQALLAFQGDVYQSFETESYTDAEYEYAQKHLRILSGLYGVIKPLDLIQAYRLEMGTSYPNSRGKNLYEFWKEKITAYLNKALNEFEKPVLVNLASNEYFKAVDKKSLNATIITPAFKDERNGTYKSIFLYAKQARGAMCDFAIKHHITDPMDLKSFKSMGYQFNEELSTKGDWIFTR